MTDIRWYKRVLSIDNLPNKEDLVLVVNEKDVADLREELEPCSGEIYCLRSFYVRRDKNREIVELWGYYGLVPFGEKHVYQII